MLNKKYSSIFLTVFLVLSLALAACAPVAAPAGDAGGDSGEAASDGGDGEAMSMKIGLVTDVGRVNDRSFNQSAWEGVVGAGEMMGLTEGDDYKYIETQDSKDYADNIQQFIDAGYDVVVTVGFALGGATVEAAAANPDTYFIGV